jgi:phage tail sheath protein FI
MVQLKFKSPGVSTKEIDLTGPANVTPIGVPAGVIGTAAMGPAFVPMTFATLQDFKVKFGDEDNAGKFGPIAVAEWLRNAQALTYMRVLGVGTGLRRTSSGDNAGKVQSAGFVVGEQQPDSDGVLTHNPYANVGGPNGRVHFLGCYMSESAGSTVFSEAGIQAGSTASPIVRGILMAASGVVPMVAGYQAAPPASSLVANAGLAGGITGSVVLLDGAVSKQEFVLFLNGHKGADPAYPRVITASFDMTAANYFGNILNKDPLRFQEAGHFLYTQYDIHPQFAVVTGTAVVTDAVAGNQQPVAFLTTGSATYNSGSATVPSFENFEDRYRTASSTYIVSQKFGGKNKNLFKVHALSDGALANSKYKITIENIFKSNIDSYRYGTFDVVVRDWSDTDDDRIVLERFSAVTLDPGSDRYVARVIGDMHMYYDWDKNTGSQKLRVEGQYENRSNLIRVEMSDELEAGEIDATALPIGFRGPRHLSVSGSAPLATVGTDAASLAVANILNRAKEPPVPYRRSIAVGTGQKKNPNKDLSWGVQFETQVSVADPNSGKKANTTVESFTKYLPNFQTEWMNFIVGDNEGTLDTAANGIIDADRYNNNLFTLENIKVVTGSDGVATTKELNEWIYVRAGGITANSTAKTRAFDPSIDLGSAAVRNISRFTLFMQGGFDGVNIFNVDESELTDKAITEEMATLARGQNNGPTVKAYHKALEIMGNTAEVDVKLLAVPGIRHEVVTDRIIDTVESRFDAMAIIDIEERDALNAVVTSSTTQAPSVGNTADNFNDRALDTSFAAAYYPDVIMTDPFSGLESRVPPTVAALGALALNDSISRPWFAPAGYTRGVLQTTIDTAVKLSRANLDDLYEVDINPITSFPGSDGVVVWGQKTLKRAQSALDRINVRRLLIEIRREVKRVANTLLFEPNREETLARFSSLVNPILKRIQEQQGLDGFRVIIDTTTTTQADVENLTIRGKIFLRPTKVAEFIDLDFVITNQGGLA